MSYENPQVPHEVNVARDSPIAEFLRLVAGLVLVVALVSAALFLAGGWLARFIPFATEVSWVGYSWFVLHHIAIAQRACRNFASSVAPSGGIVIRIPS